MADNMKQIYGTNNAFEYSTTQVSAATEVRSTEVFIPSNVASIVMQLRRKAGAGKFKIQTSTSTGAEIRGETGASLPEWFDWDIAGADVNGWVDQDEVQWWVPIVSWMRLVTEAGVGTTVYFSMRAN